MSLTATCCYHLHQARTVDCITAKAPRRNVYDYDLVDYGDDDINDTYNLDSDIMDLQANVHKQHPHL